MSWNPYLHHTSFDWNHSGYGGSYPPWYFWPQQPLPSPYQNFSHPLRFPPIPSMFGQPSYPWNVDCMAPSNTGEVQGGAPVQPGGDTATGFETEKEPINRPNDSTFVTTDVAQECCSNSRSNETSVVLDVDDPPLLQQPDQPQLEAQPEKNSLTRGDNCFSIPPCYRQLEDRPAKWTRMRSQRRTASSPTEHRTRTCGEMFFNGLDNPSLRTREV